jgi:hypothetical protein
MLRISATTPNQLALLIGTEPRYCTAFIDVARAIEPDAPLEITYDALGSRAVAHFSSGGKLALQVCPGFVVIEAFGTFEPAFVIVIQVPFGNVATGRIRFFV